MKAMALDLPGYTLNELLYEGRRSRIYRGRRASDRRPVVAKVHDAVQPETVEAGAACPLLRELAIGRLVSHGAVIRYLGFETRGGHEVLIEEDFGARGLDQLIPEAGLAPELFLEIAVRLAAGLAAIHEQAVVHKDVQPSNMVWNRFTGVVKFIDFGIAARLGEEDRQELGPRQPEGSLHYMSPEQTGRLDRPLDSRTDLYSLGVSFYEMLTGRLPFATNDPLELIHAHIARTPAALSELCPGVPEVLSEIVLRMLRKDPEERYQAARGLEADLVTCRALWRGSGSIARFELGREDPSQVFKIPPKLYGPKVEVDRLLAAFERAADASSRAEASPLLREGLIQPLAEESQDLVRRFCFAHDRIHQAACSLLEEAARADSQTAWRYAAMAAELADGLDEAGARGRAHTVVAFVEHRARPLSAVEKRFEDAYQLCLEGGDLNCAALAASYRLGARLLRGLGLRKIDEETLSLAPFIRRASVNIYEGYLQPVLLQPVALLLGRTRSTASFDGGDFQEERFLATIGNDCPIYRASFYAAKLQIFFLFGRIEEGLALVDDLEMMGRGLRGQPEMPHAWMFMALTRIAALDRGGEEERHARSLDELERQLQVWADHCPRNHRYKVLLVAAERTRRRGDLLPAIDAYKAAIHAAADSGYAHHEALGQELFGRFWLQWDEPDYARIHLLRARALYERWGATTKVAHLEECHGALLAEPWETSTGGINLDLGTVVNASRTISGEIRLERLVVKMMRIVLHSAGAQRGRLVLERGGVRFVTVDVTEDDVTEDDVTEDDVTEDDVTEDDVTEDDVTEGAVRVRPGVEGGTWEGACRGIVELARRSGARLVVADALHDERFAADPYVARHRVRSVLCVPVRTRAETSGLLYLENNLVSYAFTEERLEILQMLLAQSVISLDNAILVAELTREVAEHQAAEKQLALQAAELTRQNAELERFTSIVSHELENPLATIRSLAGALRQELAAGRDELVTHGCQRILREAATMHRLLDGFLELARAVRRPAAPLPGKGGR